MKILKLILCLAIAVFIGFGSTSCATAPSDRVQVVQTLAAVGITAKSSVDQAARMLARGEITVVQFRKIGDFYDRTFQPAYTIAVNAVRSDLSSIAAPELIGLSAQLAALVAQLTTKPASP